mmetsp:Transcript_16117/g.56171  ORF Transcript_16117/g.56171 Transcript_16117/m.56171 type:complete len:489 (-) Transcript_16117:65-1531(-)
MADVEHRASASAGRNERISSKEKARPSNLAMNKDGKGGHSQMVNPIAKGTPLSPRTPHGLRTYSHALSMARAQAAARISRGGGPKSPRRKKIILEFLAEASWYHPGRTKLKEVTPRKVLQRNIDLMDDFLGKARFTSSEHNETVHKIFENGQEKKTFYNLDIHSPVLFSCGPARVERPPRKEVSETESEDEWTEASSAVERLLARKNKADSCEPKNHTNFLRLQVYSARCEELEVKENSAVVKLLDRCLNKQVCYCSLSDLSFSNFMMGDRGLIALLPLLTFGRKLKCLNLTNNNLRSDSVRQLCAILGDALVLTTLMLLDLSNNPLGCCCTDELMNLLTVRPSLLMLGTQNTQLRPGCREKLMKKSLANFGAADWVPMDQAVRYSERKGNFTDLDLRIRCDPLLEAAMNRPSSPGERRRMSTDSPPGTGRSSRVGSARLGVTWSPGASPSPPPTGGSPSPPPQWGTVAEHVEEEEKEEPPADSSTPG